MSKFPQKPQEPVDGTVNLTVANVDPWGWITLHLGDVSAAIFVLPHTRRKAFLVAADRLNFGLPGTVIPFPATAERCMRYSMHDEWQILIRIPFEGVSWKLPESVAAELFFPN